MPSSTPPPRPVPTRLRQRAARILAALSVARPVPRVELRYEAPWQLLVATILSAQCTDQRVNQVTPAAFRRYPTPEACMKAEPSELEGLIRSTGFFKSKAKHLIECSRAVYERYHGQVPRTMEALSSLPGVGRKTANVVLGNAFGVPSVIVDTHVKRVAGRLGFTRSTDPDRIELDLQRLMPMSQWTSGSQQLLLHGRYVCLARKPKCDVCPVFVECRWKGKKRT